MKIYMIENGWPAFNGLIVSDVTNGDDVRTFNVPFDGDAIKAGRSSDAAVSAVESFLDLKGKAIVEHDNEVIFLTYGFEPQTEQQEQQEQEFCAQCGRELEAGEVVTCDTCDRRYQSR